VNESHGGKEPEGSPKPSEGRPHARADPSGSDPNECGVQPHDEEVTLADLLDVLIRRRRLVVATFALVLLATIVVTVATPPAYTAVATIEPTNERDTVLALLGSDEFAADVAMHLGAVDELGDGNATLAGQTLQEHVTIRDGSQASRSSNAALIEIEAEATTATRAGSIAKAYTATLGEHRGHLENVTWDKNWQKYYEQAGKNETKAKAQLRDLVTNMGYYETVDKPTVPPQADSPNWSLNLALGVTLSVMLALFVPFLMEGVANALDERRDGADPP